MLVLRVEHANRCVARTREGSRVIGQEREGLVYVELAHYLDKRLENVFQSRFVHESLHLD